MSSHHIVREKQEPALLILGLDSFSEELLGQLLEWSPTIITTPDTAEKLNSFGIKIDWIIASGCNETLQSDVKLMQAGNDTPIVAALAYLAANNYPAVNIITDELDLEDFLPYTDKINLVIFNSGKKIYPVSSGFSKWKQGGETITVLSQADGLITSGLIQNSNDSYQTVEDGFFALQFKQPFVFIAEEVE